MRAFSVSFTKVMCISNISITIVIMTCGKIILLKYVLFRINKTIDLDLDWHMNE